MNNMKSGVVISVPLQNIGDTIMAMPAVMWASKHPPFKLDLSLFTNHINLINQTDIIQYIKLVNCFDVGHSVIFISGIYLLNIFKKFDHIVEECFRRLGYEPSDIKMQDKNYPKAIKNWVRPKVLKEIRL